MKPFFMSRFEEVTLVLFRIVTGFLLIPHGAQKLFGAFGKEAAPLASVMGLAGVLEFFGGLLILAGLFTRPTAFILSGLMAVAYFTAHAPGGFWPIVNKGELAALYAFVFLYLSARGGGRFSVDGVLDRRHGTGAAAHRP